MGTPKKASMVLLNGLSRLTLLTLTHELATNLPLWTLIRLLPRLPPQRLELHPLRLLTQLRPASSMASLVLLLQSTFPTCSRLRSKGSRNLIRIYRSSRNLNLPYSLPHQRVRCLFATPLPRKCITSPPPCLRSQTSLPLIPPSKIPGWGYQHSSP